MKKKGSIIIVWTLLFFSIVALASEKAPVVIGIQNAGFENGMTGWKVRSKTGIHKVELSSIGHSGKASLLVKNAGGDSVTITSQPVDLKVGHLYKLSGWIKSEGAFSDPMARYPTALPACLSMYSFPFTNNSPAVGATSDWQYVDVQFIATKSKDRVQLHFGYNGLATGSVWFDDLKLEKMEDISGYIPMETVRWFKEGYRYDDKGWIFVHIEGEPYERGYQYGYLLADEIVQYMTKLGARQSEADFVKGWNDIRFMSDAMMLRKYDPEYLEEMRGIADGAAYAGAVFDDRPLDLIDIVGINSVIDLGQMRRALGATPHYLTGRNFLREEEEMLLPDDYNKCSSFVATKSATTDGRFVFGQIFMWNGYTGVHWDVICDVVPSKGNRLVYHTFPGGIHSGADFYINSAGIVMGETTVQQTPYDADGIPQSNRIRKAAQYATSFEEVREILEHKNNGQYTNDWTLADAKTDEGGCLLLGTKKSKLWRTGHGDIPADTPGNLKDFIWANNNNRDPEVRKEYIPHPENRPFDLIFRPANRDIAFQHFYREYGDGKIDSIAGVNLWASSPINRAHACDGKITTGEMADQLVFLAHYGKTTLREKMVGERFIADLPTAKPHLTLGYSIPSPIFITDKLKEARAKMKKPAAMVNPHNAEVDISGIKEALVFDRHDLWQNTVYPAAEADNWFISATSAYWGMLREMSDDPMKALEEMRNTCAELNMRYLYLVSREGEISPLGTDRVYDRYNHYYIPRIKGTFALHQLRLLLGNEMFSKVMNTVHDKYVNKEMTTEDFINTAVEVSKRSDLKPFILQWLERKGLPDPKFEARIGEGSSGAYNVEVTIKQDGAPYHFLTSVKIETDGKKYFKLIEVNNAVSTKVISVEGKPARIVFNTLNDIPVKRENFYTMGNFIDDFHNTIMVFGTKRQVEANHTLCKNWCRTLADAYVEILVPVKKDCEVTDEELAGKDIILMGSPDENIITERLAKEGKLPLTFGMNMFSWENMKFKSTDDGMVFAMPSPFDDKRVLYLFAANSQLQMHNMTKKYQRGMGTWTLFKGDEIRGTGYLDVPRFTLNIAD